MILMPALGYETVMNFHWPELKSWHEVAMQTYKSMRGIE
jgi:hypothetical protein